MVQQIGETTDAILEDLINNIINPIIDKNKNKKDPYFILIFAKPTINKLDGRCVAAQTAKVLNYRPASFIGSILLEIDNKTGKIKQEVNQSDIPIDIEGLMKTGAKESNRNVCYTKTLGNVYRHK